MNKLSDMDLGWVAGLLEGEGCFMTLRRQGSIAVNMTDRDVMQRLFEITGVGHLNGPYFDSAPNHKPVWRWAVHRRNDVIALCGAVMPLLGERRRDAAQKVLDHLRDIERILKPCGTSASYARGCHCEHCTAANTDRCRDARKRKTAA